MTPHISTQGDHSAGTRGNRRQRGIRLRDGSAELRAGAGRGADYCGRPRLGGACARPWRARWRSRRWCPERGRAHSPCQRRNHHRAHWQDRDGPRRAHGTHPGCGGGIACAGQPGADVHGRHRAWCPTTVLRPGAGRRPPRCPPCGRGLRRPGNFWWRLPPENGMSKAGPWRFGTAKLPTAPVNAPSPTATWRKVAKPRKSFKQDAPPGISLTPVIRWRVMGTSVPRINRRELVTGVTSIPPIIRGPGCSTAKSCARRPTARNWFPWTSARPRP